MRVNHLFFKFILYFYYRFVLHKQKLRTKTLLMKRFSLILTIILPFAVLSQKTITSISNGIASNPAVWDCQCFPATNDKIIVNHNITMNTNWLISGGGSIVVNWGASFNEDSQYRSILIDGNGSRFVNHGTTKMTTFGVINGAEVQNHYVLSLDSALLVGIGSTYFNYGNTIDLDSTYIQGKLVNEGVFKKGDFLNDGTVINSGYIRSDSLANRGSFISSAGNIEAYDFGNNGSFEISGSSYMTVSNNSINDGHITIAAGRSISIDNDFSNVNTNNGSNIYNDGLFEVGNNFLNMDTLRGSGVFCISESSANHGVVIGTLDICDNTGTGYFDINTGTIAAGVTDCASGCVVNVEEEKELENISIYPNPVENTLNIQTDLKGTFNIIDITGNQVLNGQITSKIDLSNLSPAIYFIQLNTQSGVSTIKFIKK